MPADPYSKIYIIGAGPGDPELLTMKAYRLISEAEVLLHDDLVGKPILNLAPPDAIKINVGKRYGDGKDQQQRQREIVDMIIHHLKMSKKIVRLKGGDPMIFGRGVEEALALQNRGVEFEMIPGITAGIAAGNIARIPLTERMCSEGLMLVTGSTANDREAHYKSICDWLMIGNTVLLYMGFKRFSIIRKKLYEFGLSPDIAACAVSKASLPDQLVVFGTIGNIETEAEKKGIQLPVLLLLGKYIRQV